MSFEKLKCIKINLEVVNKNSSKNDGFHDQQPSNSKLVVVSGLVDRNTFRPPWPSSLKTIPNLKKLSGHLFFLLPIYHKRQPYVKSYCQSYPDNLDEHHCLVINYKHFHWHNKRPMPTDILPNTQGLHNPYVLLDEVVVDPLARKNYLKEKIQWEVVRFKV